MARDEKKKHTLFLRAGDFDYLDSLLRHKGISASSAIRRVISRYVDDLRSRENPLDTSSLGDLEHD